MNCIDFSRKLSKKKKGRHSFSMNPRCDDSDVIEKKTDSRTAQYLIYGENPNGSDPNPRP